MKMFRFVLLAGTVVLLIFGYNSEIMASEIDPVECGVASPVPLDFSVDKGKVVAQIKPINESRSMLTIGENEYPIEDSIYFRFEKGNLYLEVFIFGLGDCSYNFQSKKLSQTSIDINNQRYKTRIDIIQGDYEAQIGGRSISTEGLLKVVELKGGEYVIAGYFLCNQEPLGYFQLISYDIE